MQEGMDSKHFLSRSRDPWPFQNRLHESWFDHASISGQTIGLLYHQMHEQLAQVEAVEAIHLAERFCRTAEVAGIDTATAAGFDWVFFPRGEDLFRGTISLNGASIPLMAYPGMSASDLQREAFAWAADQSAGSPSILHALKGLSSADVTQLFFQVDESLLLAVANQEAADRLQVMRLQLIRDPGLPAPACSIDVSALLRHFGVPEAESVRATAHLEAAYGGSIAAMHAAEVLSAAYATSPHAGLLEEPPWQTWLCETACTGNECATRACLRMGADPNCPNACGQAPLHLAARHGHPEVVRRLLAAGGDPALTTPAGDSVLHVAAEQRHARVCLALLAGGANAAQLNRQGLRPGDAHRSKEKDRGQTCDL